MTKKNENLYPYDFMKGQNDEEDRTKQGVYDC